MQIRSGSSIVAALVFCVTGVFAQSCAASLMQFDLPQETRMPSMESGSGSQSEAPMPGPAEKKLLADKNSLPLGCESAAGVAGSSTGSVTYLAVAKDLVFDVQLTLQGWAYYDYLINIPIPPAFELLKPPQGSRI